MDGVWSGVHGNKPLPVRNASLESLTGDFDMWLKSGRSVKRTSHFILRSSFLPSGDHVCRCDVAKRDAGDTHGYMDGYMATWICMDKWLLHMCIYIHTHTHYNVHIYMCINTAHALRRYMHKCICINMPHVCSYPSASETSAKGSRPQSIANRITPRLHTSRGGPISGSMQILTLHIDTKNN